MVLTSSKPSRHMECATIIDLTRRQVAPSWLPALIAIASEIEDVDAQVNSPLDADEQFGVVVSGGGDSSAWYGLAKRTIT